MSIARMAAMAALADVLGDRPESVARQSPAAACATLREIASRYDRACPFKPGQLVTPDAASDLRGKGEPHIVLEVLGRPEPDFATADSTSDTFSNGFGARRDIRVARVHGDKVATFWCESWQFEPYTGPGSEAQAA